MNDDGLPELAGELELSREELALEIVRGVVAVEVEPRLADRDGSLVGEQLTKLVEAPGVGVSGLVRVDPERGEDALLSGGDGERLATGVEPGADRDDPAHAGRSRAGHDHLRRLGAGVEVRVRVDQAAAVGKSTRGKSGAAGSIPSVAGVTPAATRSRSSSIGWPNAPRIWGTVSGR